MSATSTAVFTAIGIPFANFMTVLQTLFSQTLQFALDILVQFWPFWLGLALIALVFGIIFAALHFFRRRG